MTYLYTAGVNEEGEFIYLVDGLPEDEDFRYPGDLIEEEILPQMQRALEGEIVYPDHVVKTSWGNIFITYFPFYERDSENILGVLGIEFEADDLYNEYKILKILTTAIVIIACSIAFILSAGIFRRMSNPHIESTTTIDSKTLALNRSAFSLEMHDIQKRANFTGKSLILFDIDKLKDVNQLIGPHEGDMYVKIVAETIMSLCKSNMIAYRLAGSEFAVVSTGYSEEELETFCEEVVEKVHTHDHLPIMKTGLSYGFATYDKEKDLDIHETFRRTDHNLQNMKRLRTTPAHRQANEDFDKE